MSYRLQLLLTTILALLAATCNKDLSIPPDTFTPPSRLDLVAPAAVLNNSLVPIVLEESEHDFYITSDVSGTVTLQSTHATLRESKLNMKKGRGSLTTRISGTGKTHLSVVGESSSREINVLESFPVNTYRGSLIETHVVWDASVEHHITQNLIIPEYTELRIQAGTRVVLHETVNLEVYGTLVIEGTREQPVWFTSAEAAPWGGLEFHNTKAHISYCFFTQGGGDASRVHGHSNSQAVVLAEKSNLVLDHCYFIDNVGKAVGGMHSRVSIDNCLISRCDTGGETHQSRVHISNTHILEIPNDDDTFVDDDNDGFYVASHLPENDDPSRIENCVIYAGKDDAIDHNLAKLEIHHCWLEGFAHEGVAGSNGNFVRVFNTVVKDCEQGIEAGYTEPQVFVDHCVIVNNKVGLRFGDSYKREHNGHMTVTNTILFNNEDNIWNYSLLTESAVPGAIDISYSLTNDAEYDSATGCLSGTPLFDRNYYLKSSSPGKGAASDGSDMGLVPK